MSDDLLKRLLDGVAAREEVFNRIKKLETRLDKAAKALKSIAATAHRPHVVKLAETTIADIKGGDQ